MSTETMCREKPELLGQSPDAAVWTAPRAPVGTEGRQPGVKRLVYILAASHSGSTLLTMLLAAHPDICTVGELKAVIPGDAGQYRCSCGRRIVECPFWARVREGMARRGLDFHVTRAYADIKAMRSRYTFRLLRPLHRGPRLERLRDAALWLSTTWRRECPIIQRRSAALVDTVCETTGTNIVVDSSKYGLRLKYLLRNPAIDVRIIRLIRDGRAVAATYHVDEGRLPMPAAAREWHRWSPRRFRQAGSSSRGGPGYRGRFVASTAGSGPFINVMAAIHAAASLRRDRRNLRPRRRDPALAGVPSRRS